MAIVIGVLLVVFSIGVVLYPFLKRQLHSGIAIPQSEEENEARRRTIYADIETLELEKGLGHVDEQEYQQKLRGYRLAAAATFRDQEALSSQQKKLSEDVDEEVNRIRRARRQGSGRVTCPECGGPVPLAETTCPSCGASQTR